MFVKARKRLFLLFAVPADVAAVGDLERLPLPFKETVYRTGESRPTPGAGNPPLILMKPIAIAPDMW